MQLSGNQEPLTSVLRSVINKGKIALTASVGVDGESTVASGSMEVPDDLNLKMLADQLELDFNSENGFNIVRSNADLFKFFNFAYLKQFEDTLRFCFSNQFSATEANEPAKPAESTMPSQSLVSIHLDFEKIINWPNPVLASQFIEDPERSYQRARELSRNRPGREDASESSSEFKSFAGKIFEGGDWSVNFGIAAESSSLAISTTVGREAYYWYVVRQELATATELKH